MKYLYQILIHLALPFIFLRLLWRSRKNPAYRQRWSERLGRCPLHFEARPIWIHAVSVGEVQATAPLVKSLRQRYPDTPLLMTTTTPTGAEHVRRLFHEQNPHAYCPLDLPLAVQGFLQRLQPRLLLMMETEIWPNLLSACESQGIPTLLANARLSAQSAQGYTRLGPFSRQVFGQIRQIAAQSDADAQRFRNLGVGSDRVAITGSLKFDLSLPASLLEQAEVLRRELGTERPVWVAASTREGEEISVIRAHRQLLQQLPDCLLILVPRHLERFDQVAQLCQQQGLAIQRRSDPSHQGQAQVYLGDSMGELPLLLAAGDAAFIGGSLVKLGGHNVLEAAVLGKAVAFGPYMFNFPTISRWLLAAEAAVEVQDAESLAAIMRLWLTNADLRDQVGEEGRQLVARHRGAGKRLLPLIEKLLAKEA
jgi:3-deoxy-D-manno-octulosonic-acid transferase